MIVRLKATFYLDVEVPDDPNYNAEFDLVENHCLDTGLPGKALRELMAKHDALGTCWACASGAELRIVPNAPEKK
jgi:hypothetical protein